LALCLDAARPRDEAQGVQPLARVDHEGVVADKLITDDMVGEGLVGSMARPGGNTMGILAKAVKIVRGAAADAHPRWSARIAQRCFRRW